MSERPNDANEPNDELRERIARLEAEFGQRREPSPLDFGPPTPPSARVGLRLPLAQPLVAYVLLAINIVMYGVTLLVESRISPTYSDRFFSGGADTFTLAIYLLGAKWGPAINGGQYWRLLMPIVLHGSFIHLAFNSYALYALGPQSERVYGRARFLAVYLLAGLGGSIASYVVAPEQLAIGASGAIFGLIGALAAMSYTMRSLIGPERADQQLRQLVGMAAVNLVLGFVMPSIDNSAHIGGLVVGALAGLALAPRYVVNRRSTPPTLDRVDRPANSWLYAGIILVALIVVVVATLGRGHLPTS